ncbi:CDP-diacylglycerol--serine O-phosphatidyltransferase [Candidatus Neomarinimicrobiota bacterium]
MPSLFTLMNMFLGFLAVISIVEGYAIRAGYLILAAGIFDILDGKIARWSHGLSRFGMELDSLADVVSFCLAPALMVWFLYTSELHPIVGALIAGAPMYFGAIRLARYNEVQSIAPLSYFVGLPSPVNATVVVGLVFYYNHYGYGGGPQVILPAVMASSILMISHIPYPKPPFLSINKGWGNNIYLGGVLLVILCAMIWGAWVLLPGIAVYVMTGLIRWLTRAYSAEDLQSVEKEI